ncbi:hypothetical protein BN2127_JRS1_04550 [Bacillus cereus]|nr:hypothetical protein BN2127_JRS1_04550 [Bacillus cereus]
MKVKCIKNSGDTFSEELLKQGYNRDSIINLEIYKEYVVYINSLFFEKVERWYLYWHGYLLQCTL